MKNLLFGLLLSLATFAQLYAQKQLPEHIQPYAENWRYPTVHLLHLAGFDLPTFKTSHTYPDAGVEVVTEYIYENGAWVILLNTTLISDELGRLVEAFSQVYDPQTGTYTPDSRLENYNRGDSPDLIDSFFVSVWSVDENDWQPLFSTWNTFDNQDVLLESLSSIEFFGFPILLREVYTYDANGNNTLVDIFTVDNGVELPAGKRENTFAGNLLESATSFVAVDEEVFVPESRQEFTYTGSDQLETQYAFIWDEAMTEWIQEEFIVYEYDSEGRINAKETLLTPIGGPAEFNRVTYGYVQDDYIGLETFYLWDDGLDMFVLSEKKYYYYTEQPSSLKPEPIADRPLEVFPNPTQGQITLNGPASMNLEVYNTADQLVRTFGINPGVNQLNFARLLPGMYLVRGLTDQEVYTARIVVQP